MRRQIRHALPALIVSCAMALSSAAHGQTAIPADIKLVLSSAAQAGDKALVEAVTRAIQANPALADAIVQEAFMQALEHQIRLNPQATTQILDAARSTGIPLDPSRMASLAQNAGVSFGGGASIIAVAAAPLSPVVMAGMAVAAVGGIAAAAGGGGGSDDDSTPAAVPGDFETAEYNAQYGLGLINASTAYARGATGSGITVGIIDTGLDITHTEFSGRIVSAQNFAGDRATDDVTDDDDHGTHVAGIVAAAKNSSLMHGVAYGASIMPLRVFEADGSSGVANFVNAYDHAIANGADVLNGSYGQPLMFSSPLIYNTDQTLYNAMKRATDAGVILVFASGNDGDDNPTIPALYPYVTAAHAGTGVYTEMEDIHNFSALEGMLLAVTAVDSTGTIATYANRCGVAQDWCLAAPGSSILSTIPGGSDTMSGTSMAAPHVSGAIAVLLDMFPTLTPAQVVQLLLDTADSSFAGYDANIYGQGLLDLSQATQPLGLTAIPMVSASASLTASAFTTSGSVGDSFLKAAQDQKLVFLDSLGRAYEVNLAAFARAANSMTLSSRMDSFLNRTTAITAGGQTEMAFIRSGRAMENTDLRSATFRHDLGQGEQLAATFGTTPARMFGLAAAGETMPSLTEATGLFSNPYMALEEGTGLAFSTSDGWTFGSFSGQQDGLARHGTVAEYRHRDDEGRLLAIQAGLSREEDGFLGTQGSGAFAFAKGTPTLFTGISSTMPIGHGWRVLADANLGISFAKGAETSLITGVSPVSSMAWSLGLAGESLLQKQDRLFLSIGQPLHVLSGEARFQLPNAQAADGTLSYSSLTTRLAPTAPETRFAAGYERKGFGGLLSWSRNPGSLANVRDEGTLLLRYHTNW